MQNFINFAENQTIEDMKQISTSIFRNGLIGSALLLAATGVAATPSMQARFEVARLSESVIRKSSASFRKSVAPFREASAPVMRPSWERMFLYEDGDWTPMGKVTYTYDAEGREICSVLDEGAYVATCSTRYDEYGNRAETIQTVGSGEETINFARRTYEYDPVVHDYCVNRMGYDWGGDEWVPNYFCETNQVTRDEAGNITSIIKSLPYSATDKLVEAYKSVWGYDAATGQADTYAYYMNMTGSTPNWELYLDTEYRDIKWAQTNGQLTGELMDMIQGDNRFTQATVYYQDKPDGYVFIDYPEGQATGYKIRMTTNDPEEVGMTQALEEIIESGGEKRIIYTKTEYFDDETGEISSDFTYRMIEEVELDKYGNLVRDEIFEQYGGEEKELVAGQIVTNTYDEDSNLVTVVSKMYQYDEDTESGEYVEDMCIEYGDYINVAQSGVQGAIAGQGALCIKGAVVSGDGRLEVYAIDGRRMAETIGSVDLSKLPKGVYIVRGAAGVVKVRN